MSNELYQEILQEVAALKEQRNKARQERYFYTNRSNQVLQASLLERAEILTQSIKFLEGVVARWDYDS